MITNILINALGQAIFESFGQALLIYVVLQLVMQFFPALGSKYRYDVNYLGLTIISCWFLANLVKIYLHNMAMPHYRAILYTGGITYTSHHAKSLLQQAEALIGTYAKYITGAYLLALMVQGIRLASGFMHVQQIRKEKSLLADEIWSAKALELVKKLKISKKVSLFLSEKVNIPLTIGHLKPIIIFPIALINNLDTDQVEAVLLHELAHIKRHDYLLNIIQCVMETVLCFNPFVWLISKTIREQREYCCDDMVIDEDCNNYTYSRALFIIAQQNEQNYTLAMASTGSKKYPLLNRIKRLNMKTQDTLPKFHLMVVLVIAALGLFLTWGIPQYSYAKALLRHKIKTYHAVVNTINSTKYTTINTHYVHNINAVPQPPAPPVLADTVPPVKAADTLRKHNSVTTITIVDDNGNAHTYHSLAEMPKADKDAFLKENPGFAGGWLDTNFASSFRKFKMDTAFRRQMVAMNKKMREQMDNPAWRKQMADAQAKLREQMNNPEWKKQMADAQAKLREQFNNPEWKKQMADAQAKLREELNNPEWKKQMADAQAKLREQMNSPEWKKQMADAQAKLREQFNSPEWKKQMKDLQEQTKNFNRDYRQQLLELKKQNEELREELKKKGDHKFDEVEKDSTTTVKP